MSDISGSHLVVNEILAVLGYYGSYIGSLLPTFLDRLSFPFSRDK